MFIILLYIYFFTSANSVITETSYLGIEFVPIIFISNTLAILICLGLALMGIGLPFIIIIIIRYGISLLNNSSFLLVYSISVLPHGIIEFLVLFYIFELSIDMIKKYFELFSGKEPKLSIDYKQLLFDFNKIMILLFIGSIIEVFVSNRLFMLLLERI